MRLASTFRGKGSLSSRLVAIAVLGLCAPAQGKPAGDAPWVFTAAGASADCGSAVMPAIAAASRAQHAAFHWHLGGFRHGSKVDKDALFLRVMQTPGGVPGILDYAGVAQGDVREHQIKLFAGERIYTTFGAPEEERPLTKYQFQITLREQFEYPELVAQRAADGDRLANGHGLSPPYYHWRERNVEFISIDTSSERWPEPAQQRWIERVVTRAIVDERIRTVVVATHEPLPHSRALEVDCPPRAVVERREGLYQTFARVAAAGKRIYLLSASQHYFLNDLYATPYWQSAEHGAVVLPGVMVGTAGAERMLAPGSPPDAAPGDYGYLRAEVAADGEIRFAFVPLTRAELENAPGSDFEPGLGKACSEGNIARPVRPVGCDAPVAP